MQKKLFIVVHQDYFFLSHRLPIGLAAQKAGYEVTIVAGNTGDMDKVREYGFKTIDIPMQYIQ